MFWYILSSAENIAELCKGSTTDSDSVCLGSNPSSAANKSNHPTGWLLLFDNRVGFEPARAFS